MPPGPTPLPFIGNKLPKRKPWIQFQKWSKIYGPIFTVWLGRRPTVVISDPHIAAELMEKRSNTYSSRPRFVVMGEIYSSGSVLVQPYGKEWSLRRKLLHRALTPAALRTYKARQVAEASRLVVRVMNQSDGWEREFDRFTASVVFTIAYGRRIDSLDASVIRDRFKFMQFMATLNVPGAYMAESFPILRYLPDFVAPWKREIRRNAALEAASSMGLVEGVKLDLQRRDKRIPITTSLTQILLSIQEIEEIALSDKDFAQLPASLFGAGSDTTASSMCSAILALVTHPSVMVEAHNELDSVVGVDRSPTFEDEARLPYIQALVKEVLRWRPVAVLGGTPHASTENDSYDGYYIPKGTTILGNTWAINMNEEYYPNPQLFNPARFLSNKDDHRYVQELKGEKEHPSKSGHSSFGLGRRICPGAELAANSLFIALAKLIWAFDIVPTQTYDTFAYTDGFNIRPHQFKCGIMIRSEAHHKVLKAEMRSAEEEMEKFPAYD